MSFFEELKRRNVFRVGVAYLLLGWVVLQAADFALDLIDAPNWIIQALFIIGLVGLPFALLFAWAFELTPEGLKREHEVDRSGSIAPVTGRKLDRAIIAFLALALVLVLGERLLLAGRDEPSVDPVADSVTMEQPATSPVPAPKSVAVLPFVPLSSGEDDEFFADGLTEEILNALSQLPELLVTARTSSFAFKGEEKPVPEIGAELGVQHIVEGSVRRAGERLRVTAQLIRVQDGFQLWSESYDSTSADTIAVQEDIAVEIAAALDVVMDETRRAAMRNAGLRDPAAFIAFQRGTQASREAHGDYDMINALLAVNRYFDEVLARVPDYGPAYTERADAYVHIINDAASGESSIDSVPDELVATAFERAVADMTAAQEHARSLEEKNASEFDLAVITGDFYRIRPKIEAYLHTDHCVIGQWLDPLATVFGYAGELVERLEPVIQCNPFGPVRRFSQARAAIWAGDPERALALVEAAREKVDHPWLDWAYVTALIAAGRFESAEQDLNRHATDPYFLLLGNARLAAARGDLEAAERLRAAMPDLEDAEFSSGFLMLQYHAMLGQRFEANQLAAAIDERAYGPLPLILITMWCGCGAPFDLEATPNFAASIEQGDLPWPPRPVNDFPMKDW